MSIISKQDTNGVKPLLQVGELGYDNYPAGGDKGRVFVGTGTENIGLAKRAEVVAVDSKADAHIARVDNPHGVTKAQVGLGNADNTADVNKPISIATQTALDLKANAANAALTGVPTAPTASVGTNTTQLATTAFVNAAITDSAPTKTGTGASGTWGINITGNSASTTKLATARTINGVAFDGTGNITIADSTKAPLVSPALTGTPTSTTATDGTNTTQIATAAFVQNAVGGYLSKAITGGTVTLTEAEASNQVIAFSGALTSAAVIVIPTTTKRIWAIYNATSGAFTLTVKTAAGNGVTVAQGKRNLVYTDGTHVYDAFNDYESITLTGVSSAPTAAVGTNTTQLATTAFVNAEIANDAPTKTGSGASGTWGISVSGNAATATKLATARTINGVAFDGTGNITIADSTKAPLASPALTGAPTAPTAAAGTNTTQIATTAFVLANRSPLSDSVSTTSSTTAATSTAVKSAYDRATTALNTANANATTTTAVASATAGISAGGVGSYVFAVDSYVAGSTSTVAYGATVAGSRLYPTGIRSGILANSIAYSISTALSGTWRCMGYAHYGSSDNMARNTLWLRIA